MLPRPRRTADVLLLAALVLLPAAYAASLEAQQAHPRTPELILTGGKVFTADPACPWAEAIAIRGERILEVGSTARIARLAGPGTRRIDLAGRVVVPGFNDAHAHLGCVGGFGVPAETSDEPTPDPPFARVADSLRVLAARVPAGTWIGSSIGATVLGDTGARRAALDLIAPRHPVWLGAWTGHDVILNTAALRALGIEDTARDPLGGRYGRQAGSSQLTGLAEEYAAFAVRRRLCSLDPDSTLVASLRSTGRTLAAFGVTSVQNIAYELEPSTYLRIFGAAALPLRVRLIPTSMTTPSGALPDWERVTQPAAGTRNAAGGTLTISGVKWLLEGTPIERRAVHRVAYRDRPGYYGRLNFPPETIRAWLLEARERHAQLLLHAGGDSTIAVVLGLMEQTGGPTAWRALRVRIEHGDGLAPDLLPRARRLGMILVQNPAHLAIAPLLRERLDSVVLASYMPLRSVAVSGMPVALGSDGPLNPFLNIMLATTHPTRPEQAMTREQAVVAYTRGSAYAEFAEREKGTLSPGMLADLAVLSQDIFVVPAPALPATTSVLTMLGGRIVYDALTGRPGR